MSTTTYMDLNARILKEDGTLAPETVDISNSLQLNATLNGTLTVGNLSLSGTSNNNLVTTGTLKVGDNITLTSNGTLTCKNYGSMVVDNSYIRVDTLQAEKGSLIGMIYAQKNSAGDNWIINRKGGICNKTIEPYLSQLIFSKNSQEQVNITAWIVGSKEIQYLNARSTSRFTVDMTNAPDYSVILFFGGSYD